MYVSMWAGKGLDEPGTFFYGLTSCWPRLGGGGGHDLMLGVAVRCVSVDV
jgi:hypothetical protein